MSNSSKNIKNIVIAGGGSAGWMTAAALSKALSSEQYKITLIESADIGTVSVGEATIPNIRAFNQFLGIDENQFMQATQGTFKLGIEFVNWAKQSHCYMHPFGPYGVTLEGIPFHHYWLREKMQGRERPLADFCLEWTAAKSDLFSRPVPQAKNPLVSIKYAFHFDATLYAKYLRNYAIANGVTHLQGTIEQVNQHSHNGFVSSLSLKDGTQVQGDLFIDCSGFKGLIIDKTLGSEFIDWSHWLPCNQAIAQTSESEEVIRPYTISTAHAAGWQWQIPLQHRIGNGYVFSDQFMQTDEAINRLAQQLPTKTIGEPRILKWKNGHRKQVWIKNCVAIGLSAGFLEPLESTGLQLVQSAIMRLISLFPDGEFRPTEIELYNRYSQLEIEQIRDFIILHYKANQRQDSEFWQHCRNMQIPDSLQQKIDLYQSSGRIYRENNELFNEISWFSVLQGQGIQPAAYHPMADMMPEPQLHNYLSGIKRAIMAAKQQMPTHNDFISRYCRAHKE